VTRTVRVFLDVFGATGHVFPALALARELRSRGHEVLFCSLERWRGTVEDLGLDFTAAAEYVAFPGPWPGRPAHPTLPEVSEALAPTLRDFRPDVVVNDFFTLPATLAAEVQGLTRATLIPHPFPESDTRNPPFLRGFVPPRGRAGAALWRAVHRLERRPRREREQLNEARAELGLPPNQRLYGGMSDELVMVATFPQLEYPRRWPEHVHVTGPMLFELPHRTIELPASEQPLVVVAGSTAQDQELELLRTTLAALDGEPVRVLATINQRGREWEGALPANATVVDWVSYSDVLPRAAALVCNGGHGTVARALDAGVPLLVCPGPGDMAMNGAHVAWSGTGLMVPRRLLGRAPLRRAVRRLLDDPAYRARARAIAGWSRDNDGAARGASLLEELARRKR